MNCTFYAVAFPTIDCASYRLPSITLSTLLPFSQPIVLVIVFYAPHFNYAFYIIAFIAIDHVR